MFFSKPCYDSCKHFGVILKVIFFFNLIIPKVIKLDFLSYRNFENYLIVIFLIGCSFLFLHLHLHLMVKIFFSSSHFILNYPVFEGEKTIFIMESTDTAALFHLFI